MNNKDFEVSVLNQVEKCKNLLIAKGEYYQTSKDRLDQFKKAAVLQGISPIEALGGMMAKHSTKLFDIMKTGADYKVWDEVITDHMNYLLLLNALIEEGL